MSDRPLRVLHCPNMVGGHPAALAAAERARGLDSRTVSAPTRFQYAVDGLIWPEGAGTLGRELGRFRLLGHALRWADVVHFNFGSTILPMLGADHAQATGLRARAFNAYARMLELRDLPALRRAGKAIFVTWQGDDARQADVARERHEITHVREAPANYPPGSDALKRRRIARLDRFADGMYALNPDLLAVLPASASFFPYAHSVPLPPARAAPEMAEGAPLRVVHAPTDRSVKGTRHVVAAVDALRADGVPVALDLVEGLPQSEARARFAAADVAVDQLLAGWYGGFAMEVMAFGTPAVAYLRDADLGALPPAMRDGLPVIGATPDTIGDVLRRLATTERDTLPARGEASRAYVRRWHGADHLAERTEADYRAAVSGSRRARRRGSRAPAATPRG